MDKLFGPKTVRKIVKMSPEAQDDASNVLFCPQYKAVQLSVRGVKKLINTNV